MDNSNIVIAAKVVPGNNKPNPNIRVNIKNLVRAIERDNKLEIEIRTRIVGGSRSINASSTRVEDEWKLCLYKCMFADRIGGVCQLLYKN